MLVRQNTEYAGPNGNHHAGSVWDADEREALALIQGGYAVQVEVAENDRGEVETTANGGAPETADKKTTPDDAAAKFIKAKKRPEPAQ